MSTNARIKKLLLGVSLAAVCAAQPALAQGVIDETAGEEAAVQDVIIVTVERREQSLQDYGGTAAVISGEELSLLGLTSITELDGRIPGLSIANNQGNIEVYIRGVGSSNNTELGDPAAATHLNDVYLPRPAGVGAAFFDIQRVEVNIGPQGTIRGRNATAGSVNIIPWGPGIGVWDGMLEAAIGNYDERRVEGMINVPLLDNAAFRLSGFYTEHSSYLESVTPDSAELGLSIPTSESEGVGVAEAAEDYGVRAGFLWEPTDRISLNLTGDFLAQKGTGWTGVNYANPLGNGINPDDIKDPRKVIGRGFTPEEDTEHWGLKAELTYDGDGFNVEYIASMRDLVFDYEFVTPVSPFYDGVFANLGPLDYDNFSRIRFTTDSESRIHELRLFADEGGRLYWSGGVFYFEEDQRTFLGTTGDRNPFFQGVEFNQTTATKSLSFYGDATFDVTEDFRLSAGLRHTSDEKDRFGVNARYAFGIGGPDFSCCFINGVAHGTEGFQFAGLDRKIFNPDINGDGVIDANESIAFFFDGIAAFGARDGFDNVFPNGQQIQDAIPDPAQRPQCSDFAFVGSCNNFVPVFNGVVDFSLAPFNSSFALQNGRLENDFVDWRIRAELDVSDDSMVYGLIATGNKSGGFNDNIPETQGIATNPSQNAPIAFNTNTLAPTYEPEQLTLYEIGSKNSFRVDGRDATFNATFFYYDYKDLQLTTLLSTAQILDREGVALTPAQQANLGGSIVAFTFNAADAEIYGTQFEGSLDLPNQWTLRGNLLWMAKAEVVESVEIQDARFQADVDPVNAVNRSIEGNRLPRTPRIQFNGSIAKAFELNSGTLDGMLSFGYRSSQHMTIFNGRDYANPASPALRLDDKVDGYWTLDFGGGYTSEDGRWRLEGYVTNLTDVQEPQAIIITQFDNTRFFNAPRTFGARLRVHF
jgi:iron complex outermembrane receptor protein